MIWNDDIFFRSITVSFPSGHSSFSAYTMLYIAIYIQMKWRVNQKSVWRLLKCAVQLSLLLLAYFTALSRVMDNKVRYFIIVVIAVLFLPIYFYYHIITTNYLCQYWPAIFLLYSWDGHKRPIFFILWDRYLTTVHLKVLYSQNSNGRRIHTNACPTALHSLRFNSARTIKRSCPMLFGYPG